ncbi:DUF922 domain-containing Zn-dependent protease [Oligoflexia bacterium]|nr:DUF922 domain-containing Zn-dependent protease [Oligoflexia bacterium]
MLKAKVEKILSAPHMQIKYYPVFGNSIKELKHSLHENGPYDRARHKRFAFTQWHVSWSYPKTENGTPQLERIKVKYDITVTFPRWILPKNVDPASFQNWSNMIIKLSQHEKGHINLFFQHLGSIAEGIKKAARENPSLSSSAANEIGQGLVLKMRNNDKEYDATTASGKLQGAKF